MTASTNVGDRHRLAAEVEQRGVAAPDAEHEAAARRLLHGRRDVGERGRMAGVRVGHAGREPQPLGRRGRERDGDERVADEVLRVGERDAVPAEPLGPLGLERGTSRSPGSASSRAPRSRAELTVARGWTSAGRPDTMRRMTEPNAAGTSDAEWHEIARRNARSVQTTIGWIFWDPVAVANLDALGVPDPFGYIAARAAPLGPAGPDAVDRRVRIDQPARHPHRVRPRRAAHDVRRACGHARDEAVRRRPARPTHPASSIRCVELGPELWPVVDALPAVGRAFFAAHLRMPRPDDPLLSGGTRSTACASGAATRTGRSSPPPASTASEASILHNAWLGYEPDWLAKLPGSRPGRDRARRGRRSRRRAWPRATRSPPPASRSASASRTRPTALDDAPVAAARRGPRRSRSPSDFEPPCETLLARVDLTAGPNYQPASRLR